MNNLITDSKLIKKVRISSKTIAMVGVSSVKKKESPTLIKRRPSVIVMKYLQEYGYRVIPVNPTSEGNQRVGNNLLFPPLM